MTQSTTANPDRAAIAGQVIVTRPAGQSAALIESLRGLGCDVTEFPLIAISPAADPAQLDAALAQIGDYALVVFVSPNAIDQAFARFHGVWPEHVPVAVVGPGSIAALSRHGVVEPRYRIIAPEGAVDQAASAANASVGLNSNVSGASPSSGASIAPDDANAHRAAEAARFVASDSFFPPPPPPKTVEAAAAATAGSATVSASTDVPVDPDSVRFDSETLIQALDHAFGLDSFRDKRVLLVRGDGGRELVADTLRERGAIVEPIAAYRRSVPSPDPDTLTQVRRWLGSRDPVWVVTSSEAVRNLDTLASIHFDDPERAMLRRARFVVPHPRIAESARATGFDRVTISGAGDAALVRAIEASLATPREDRAPVPAASPGLSVHSATEDRDVVVPASRTGETPAASSTPRGASSSMTDSKDTSSSLPPTRFSASGAERHEPGTGRQRGRLLLAWLALIIAVGVGVGGLALNRKLERLDRALDSREQASERTAAASTQESGRALDTAQQTDRRLSQIEGKLADAQGQQQALQNMYQDLARDRTQWTLSEIEQIVSNASQQLQLTGNVSLALFALQSADARLSQTEGAQILVIRKAIAQDIDKLKAAPSVDIPGLAIKLDDAISRIDSLPLAGEGPVPQGDTNADGAGAADSASAAQAASESAAGNPLGNAVKRFDAWWGEFGTRVLHQLSGVVQVRRIDNGDAMLVAPDQAQYLRANLRLRLLSARLSLLSRDQKTMDADLDAANKAIARYFDPNAQATKTELDLISQVRQVSTSVELPNLNASLDAIHQYKSGD